MRDNDGMIGHDERLILTDCFHSAITAENVHVGDMIKCFQCGTAAEVIRSYGPRWHWQFTCSCGYTEDTGNDMYARVKRRKHLAKYPDHIIGRMIRVDENGREYKPSRNRTTD